MQPSTMSRLKGVSCDTAVKFSCTTGRCVAARDKYTDTHATNGLLLIVLLLKAVV